MKYNIVTSCNKNYLPGLVALKHSIGMNFPKAELTCFYYGEQEELDDFADLPKGIDFIMNAEMPGHTTGVGTIWRHGLKLGPDMYARLLIPKYFSGKAFYVDVDCLVLNDFSRAWHIDIGDHMTACVYRPDIGWIGGNKIDDMASGTFLVDCDKWNENKMIDKMFDIMDREQRGILERTFNLNVESCMSYAHDGEFYHLDPAYQNLTYYGQLIRSDYIAHFAGPKPWHIEGHQLQSHVNYSELWTCYYNNGANAVEAATLKLPTDRDQNPWDKRLQK